MAPAVASTVLGDIIRNEFTVDGSSPSMNPVEGVQASHLDPLREAWGQGDVAEAAAAERSHQPLTDQQRAALSRDRRPIAKKIASGLSDAAQGIAADPTGAMAGVVSGLGDPVNLAMLAVAPEGEAADLARMAKNLRRPSVFERTIPAVVKGIGENVGLGAASELAITGEASPEGIAQQIPMTAGVMALRGLRSTKLGPQSAASGESAPHVAEPPPFAPEAAPAAPEAPTAAPEAPAAASPEPAPSPAEPLPPVVPETPIPSGLPPQAEAPVAPPMDVSAARRAVNDARADAKHYARGGRVDLAHESLNDALPAFKALFGEKAAGRLQAELEIASGHAPAAKAAPAKSSPPASIEDARAQVAQAQASAEEAAQTGDVEAAHQAIDDAGQAIQVLAPVGGEAAKIASQAKAEASDVAALSAKAPSRPADPMQAIQERVEASRPTGELTKSRPVARIGDREYKFASSADHGDDPVNAWMHDANQLTQINMDNRAAGSDSRHRALVAAGMDPVEAGKLGNDLRNIQSAAAEELPNGRTAGDVVSEGASILTGDAPEDFAGFLTENDMTPEQFYRRMNSILPSNKAQARIQAAKDFLADPSTAERNARIGGAVALAAASAASHLLGHAEAGHTLAAAIPLAGAGAGGFAESLRDLGEATADLVGKFETRGARFDRTATELQEAGKTVAAREIRALTQKVREFVAVTDDDINRMNTGIAQAAASIPTGERLKAKDAVINALEGKLDPSKLSPGVRPLYDATKSVLDELRAKGVEITGNPGRDNYVPRLENRHAIFKAHKGLAEQLGSLSEFLDQDGQMRVAGAMHLPEITNPLARAFVDGTAASLAKGLEIKDGKLSLKIDPENKHPVLENDAGYLWELTDDEGNPLPPHLPEVFQAKPVEREVDGKKVTTWEPELRTDREWNPDELKALLRGEAARILTERESYDPDAPRLAGKTSRAARASRWQTDGSLTNRRLMPYAGDAFYDLDILNVMAHAVPRQVRGLARIQMFGKDRSVVADALKAARGSLSDAQLGLVTDAQGKSRLATFADGGAFKNSLLRDYEDVLMGYARPFTEESVLYKAGEVGGEVASMLVMFAKNHPALNDLIDQETMSGRLALRVGYEFTRQRLKIAPVMLQSGLMNAASLGLEGVRLDRAAAVLRRNDPLWAYRQAGYADALYSLGGTFGDRLLNGVRKNVGGFVNGSVAGDMAARMTGTNVFAELLHELRAEGIDPRAKDGELTDALYRTTPMDAIREGMALLNDNGRPVSRDAAQRLIELSHPFAEEMASWINGSSNPLFQPRFTNSRNARLMSWLQLVPLSLMSKSISSIMDAWARGNKIGAAGRAGKLVASSAATGALKVGLWAKAPAAATLATAFLSGSILPMGMAVTLAKDGDGPRFEPDNANAKIAWDVLRNAKGLDEARALAGMTMMGLPWSPKFAEVPVATDEQMALAGRKPMQKTIAEQIGSIPLPGVSALAQQGGQFADAFKLFSRTRDPADAWRLLLAGTIAPPVREAMGKEYRERQQALRYDVNLPATMRKVRELGKGYAPALINQKVEDAAGKAMLRGAAGDYSVP